MIKLQLFKSKFSFILLNLSLAFLVYSQPIDSSFVETRATLIRKIDSLDIEKQLNKRQGFSIEDLENKQIALIDSLKSLRTIIQNEASISLIPANKITDPLSSLKSFLNPKTNFDWIIIVTSIVALFSGTVLLLGLLSTLFKKVKRSEHIKPTIKMKIEPAILPEIPSPAKPQNPYRITTKIPVLNQRTEDTDKTLQDLKSRIEESTLNIAEKPDARPPTRILTAIQSNTPPLSNDLEKMIINAVQNGLDIPEISKKFHVSTDHIALILKIWKKNSSAN
jgi:hypothetical protein